MTRLLRIINLATWLPDKDYIGFSTWLDPGDVEAAPLWDLRTKDNTLSLYQIEEGDTENINRVIAAFVLASAPRDIEYTLIQPENLHNLELNIEENRAKTPDDTVNAWHRDITHLSGIKIAKLGRFIKELLIAGDYETVTENDVIQAIVESVRAGYMKKEKVTKAAQQQADRTSTKKLLKELESIPPANGM